MSKVGKGLVEHVTKKLLNHLRSIFSSQKTHVMPPTGHVHYVDKDANRKKYPNYKKQHQRHERNR